MDPVVHFEMPYDGSARMAHFYETAFGWKTQSPGAEMGNDVTATTAPAGTDGGQAPGTINHGFCARKQDWPSRHPLVVIALGDIHAAIGQVTRAGGAVLGEPMEIPGIGHDVSFMGTERNRLSMLQPFPRMGLAQA